MTDIDLEAIRAREHPATRAARPCGCPVCLSQQDVPALIAAVQRRDDALAAVLALHPALRIYDECDCTDEQKGDGLHAEIDEIGLTCNVEAVCCEHCCADDGWHSEHCATYHEHSMDEATRCPTVAAITAHLAPADSPSTEEDR